MSAYRVVEVEEQLEENCELLEQMREEMAKHLCKDLQHTVADESADVMERAASSILLNMATADHKEP